MTKETNRVVTDLKNVVSSIKNELQQGKRVTRNELGRLLDLIDLAIADYNKTVENLEECNSLVVKFEKFMEVIGIIEYACVDDSDLLNQATNSLLEIARVAKQK